MLLPYHIPALILKRLQETITPAESATLEAWAEAEPQNRELLTQLLNESQAVADIRLFDTLWGHVVGTERYHRMEQAVLTRTDVCVKLAWRRWLPYAAAAVLSIAAGLFLMDQNDKIRNEKQLAAQDVSPGGNRATLTLADGQTIELSDAKDGIVVSGNRITYQDGSTQLATLEDNDAATQRLELSTPKGGVYRVMLPDETEVWLNAGSTLRYPSRFAKTERVVEIEGQGYFSVAKDVSRPFKVRSQGQEVTVLGTEFDILAYADEVETKTTVVTGAVSVSPGANGHWLPTVLKPGQQGVISGDKLNLRTVDVQQYKAWTEGRFYFNNTPFEEMMRQIGRWYDVEVAYKGDIPQETFSGEMSRGSSLMTVLDLLNVSAVRLRLEGRVLIVD